MSHYGSQQVSAVSYPPTMTGKGQGAPNVPAPPPMGYPSKDGAAQYPQQDANHQTTTRGDDGFWKGCCAALCCCCALDCCF